MNKVVVDSRVAIKWFIPQPHSDRAQRILNEYEAGKLTLLAQTGRSLKRVSGNSEKGAYGETSKVYFPI